MLFDLGLVTDLRAGNPHISAVLTHALTSEGHDASEDGTGRGTPIVAFDTTSITSALNSSNPQPGDPCHPLAAGMHTPAIAFLTDALTWQAFASSVYAYADATQADADQVLRVLREAIDSRDGAERALAVFAPFLQAEVLQPAMLLGGERGSAGDGNGLDDDPSAGQETGASGAVSAVRETQGVGCPPPGPRPHEQRPGEPRANLPLLSHQGAQSSPALLDLWETPEGARLLREALSAIQEVRRSAAVQAESALAADPTRRVVERGSGVSHVRRLTPL